MNFVECYPFILFYFLSKINLHDRAIDCNDIMNKQIKLILYTFFCFFVSVLLVIYFIVKIITKYKSYVHICIYVIQIVIILYNFADLFSNKTN